MAVETKLTKFVVANTLEAEKADVAWGSSCDERL